ncbi:MAG: DNA mismatch endonuclease Vsr [candidate division Zixibacteria bacterium]|nr:DNA mismatch endonuclease Vsr [candidate division Zixibacteria bacterium]
MDVHSKKQRHRNMSAIKSKDTKPEMIVRRFVHSLGYRYRLHRKDLPGKPDLVFTRKKKIIFVHGCYWHVHNCRYGKVVPKTNTNFWQKKRKSNVLRDRRNIAELKKLGWTPLVIWECKTRNIEECRSQIDNFLN